MVVKPPKETTKEKKTPPEPNPDLNPDPPVMTPEERIVAITKERDDALIKFGASSQEGIRLAKKVKELKVKLAKKADEPPLEKRISNWDDLSPEEQKERKAEDNEKKRLAKIEADQAETKKAREFDEGFDGLVEKEGFEKLATQKAAFRDYCNKNPGTPIAEAAKSFLFDSVKEIAADEERKKFKRDGLETPSGGDKGGGSPEEGYTQEEAEDLRKNNSKKYNALVRAKKLKIIEK